MTTLQALYETFGAANYRKLDDDQKDQLWYALQDILPEEVSSAEDGKKFLQLLYTFRKATTPNYKWIGDNYSKLQNSMLSVGEDGLYSDSLRFLFELIQNVDDCDFSDPEDCRLDMKFNFNANTIILTYNEAGFTPFNVFAITGIAVEAKNILDGKNEIGEKGIGFKSVFGVVDKVFIRSGWFSFELHKENFTIPVERYEGDGYVPGTIMTLFPSGKAQDIYGQIRERYCKKDAKDALFGKNPILFLNKLTSLKMYNDVWRSMEFRVSGKPPRKLKGIHRDDVTISIDLHDHDSSRGDANEKKEITCTRYVYPVTYSYEACKSRYGDNTEVGKKNNGKSMYLQVMFPHLEHIKDVGNGSLYSFLPTQLGLNVPVLCHVPFKLDASREFVDPQGHKLWFKESVKYFSDVMDYAYQDWCRIVRSDIVQYLPGQYESMVADNNGKEQCLSERKELSGRHFLELPIFPTLSGEYVAADDIFCFSPDDKIEDSQRVYELMGYSKELFLPPAGFNNMHKYGIAVEKNICNTIFDKALRNEVMTGKALDYLDEVSYEQFEKHFPTNESLSFSIRQIEELMRHEKLAQLLRKISVEYVKNKKRPRFHVTGAELFHATEVLYSDFKLSDTPEAVEWYMKLRDVNLKCVRANISDNQFLVCHNAVVLSDKNPLSSFAAFCFEIDRNDIFSIRIKLKEAYANLDKLTNDNSGSASDYLRVLRNNRSLVKDSLGDNGYRRYIKLIHDSGTDDKKRFIQELLQNADDCTYPADVKPTLNLSRKGNTLITEYNEVGFTRSNIRSITAIGESTKNKLLNRDFNPIGEKGIGFKTIFAVASEVKISSGDYHFSLTDDEPTIPRPIKLREHIFGTKMEITLKDKTAAVPFDEKSILELCLCLRKLRQLEIDGHSVDIADTEKDDRRIITIDNKRHSFKKFVRKFEVDDEMALAEKANGRRNVSTTKEIVCYVPERNEFQTPFLYVGLPTRHKVQIPIIIDAPFELTTSREEIKTDLAWNNIIRKEMYHAIIYVLDSLKAEERIRILRFARARYERRGSEGVRVNEITDCEYLNQYDYFSCLRSSRIMPTYDASVFAAMDSGNVYRYPDVATFVFDALSPNEFEDVRPELVIDTRADNISKDLWERIDSVLNALGCQEAAFSSVFPVLKKHAERLIVKPDFQTKFYEYFQREMPEEYKVQLRQLKIIPVYGLDGGNEYISWRNDSIFVKSGAVSSDSNYYVLNEELLPKSYCERMLGVNINEMNAEWEHMRYNKKLNEELASNDLEKAYSFLLQEFEKGSFNKNDSGNTLRLLAMEKKIPLKNQLNQITTSPLFSCGRPEGYFQTDMLKEIMLHKECVKFAEYLGSEELSGIYYKDILYDDVLTRDEIEELQDEDGYFHNSDEILRGFYNKGLLPDELLTEYDLEYIGMVRHSDDGESYVFPESRVVNRDTLAEHIREKYEKPIKIVSVDKMTPVKKGQVQGQTGEPFDLDMDGARKGILNIYSPEGVYGRCFCQMCQSVKPEKWIEVNNIQTKPKFFFPQLRISLCLECSKKFESMRENNSKRTKFIEEIEAADVSDFGKVDIPIGDEKITFTGKHLAEIQEIFKLFPEEDR